ncbi:hypothetical protein CHIBA101_2396 [Actinomyces sp. Chiba101]|uniref:hypothetical protein n=1 Tax=Actinomyces TaxID=1654 RepID=UPI000974F016|nr:MULTISPECIES: hypothetical protein [Actinomyces]BAW94217.1 hypothetical protein CHIBA101_2396 [Actinomyces sp. Chiba101]GAV95223.1 hypothetical protein ADENT20671_2007 [Actinomyces denticolens]SUU13185.1 Uncharacterised protein [Actinomyces denticolens]
MSAITAPMSESPLPTAGGVIAPAQPHEQGAVGSTDITVVTVALAILAILGMLTAFAAIAGSMPVVVIGSLVSVVLSVATAFTQLHRAGL